MGGNVSLHSAIAFQKIQLGRDRQGGRFGPSSFSGASCPGDMDLSSESASELVEISFTGVA